MTPGHSGVFPMLVTPFDSSGRVAFDDLTGIADYQLKAGVAGLSILGLAGESANLTSAERMAIVRCVLSVAKGVPVIVGCTAPDTNEAITLSLDAVQLNASIIMVAPPSNSAWSREDLMEHYARIANAIAPTPLMVQDAPAFVGVSLDPAFISDLTGICSNVHYAKPESVPAADAIASLSTLAGMRTFGGHGGLYCLEVLEAGAHGLIPGCEQPRAFQQIFVSWTSGEESTARQVFYSILPLLVWQFQSLDCFIASVKTILHRQGLIQHRSLRGRSWPMADVSERILLKYARQAGAI